MRAQLLLLIGFLVFLCFAPSSAADAQPQYFIRLYSDICLHPESGDLLGTRIIVLKLRDGNYVYFQPSEGEPGLPASAKAVINVTDIEFHVAEPDRPTVDFKGKLTDEFLNGRIEYDNGAGRKWLSEPMQLPRIGNLQNGFPNCK
jgi:hypothetical protein